MLFMMCMIDLQSILVGLRSQRLNRFFQFGLPIEDYSEENKKKVYPEKSNSKLLKLGFYLFDLSIYTTTWSEYLQRV